jgi:hypothetical protein
LALPTPPYGGIIMEAFMKKIVLSVLFAALTVTAVFALPEFGISAGGGGVVNAGLTGIGITLPEPDYIQMRTLFPLFSGGGFVFFDATYAELSLGILGGTGRTSTINAPISIQWDSSLTHLNIGFLLKWPFGIGNKFTIFPIIGIEYLVMLSVEDNDGEKIKDAGDFSALFAGVGVGMDFSITKQLYIRFEVLAGPKFMSKAETKMDIEPDPLKSVFYIPVKLAAGWRFF